jgi:hypothetical protein
MGFWRFRRRKSLTGLTLSATGVGINWTNVSSDQEIARNVLALLEDHRVLYLPTYREHPEYCVRSANQLRNELRAPIEECGSAELRDALRGIQAAAREFVTQMEHAYRHRQWEKDWPLTRKLLEEALEAFRALVGVQVARIVDRFDIRIDGDLARILE